MSSETKVESTSQSNSKSNFYREGGSADFMAEGSAGHALLTITAQGNSIVAELLRLSEHIPSVFLGSPGDPVERAKFAPILFDFNYLKNPEHFDEVIDSKMELVDLDEEFRENHLTLLKRFYNTFASIYRYIMRINAYIDDLKEGQYVAHTVETVLMEVEGKQLFAEALYLYGVMLLLLDLTVPGVVRERMIVAYYRYKGAATIENIDEVVKLCRQSGFNPHASSCTFSPTGARALFAEEKKGGWFSGSSKNQKHAPNYPEALFARFPVPSDVIDLLIGRLRSDDLYNHTSAFPSTAHRSVAMATQASMLYVLLYFAPKLLREKTSVMREVVDKYFSNNWVVPLYMGFTADLSVEWDKYKAASLALKNILVKQNISEITTDMVKQMDGLHKSLHRYLTQGVLVEEHVLDNVHELFQCARGCNVVIRWFFLHRTTRHRVFKDMVQKAVPVASLLRLLTQTAQFEFRLKTLFSDLLTSKESRWVRARTECVGRMTELSQYFSGEVALTRVDKNENLQTWFQTLASAIGDLDLEQPMTSGRHLTRLVRALEGVEQYHQIESNLQVKQFLSDTRAQLKKMLRTVNVIPKLLGDLDIISDFSYAWHIIHHYTPNLHMQIKQDPGVCLVLRATFLKLSSILSLPLVRITQIGSKDEVSVAEYYSSTLVKYVRSVLDIVPKSVFGVLDGIIDLMTDKLKPMPPKIERKHLKDFSQLDQRYALAKATHQVSVFTQGILNMKKTLVGIIPLDPRKLLEDGIRKELVRQVAHSFHAILQFPNDKVSVFEQQLQRLGQKLDGFRSSFEYIQDYVNLYGLKIWQEEFSRIVNYNVELESNRFLKKQVYDWNSLYQSEAIPIPKFAPTREAVTFMGRVTNQLLRLTDSKTTTYVEFKQGWYHNKTGQEVVGIRTFSLLHRGLETFGLTGMDRLISFMIVRDMHKFTQTYRRVIGKNIRGFIGELLQQLHPTTHFPPKRQHVYVWAQTKTQSIWPFFMDFVTKIGQKQLVRRQIANELNFSSKLDSKLLNGHLEAFNKTLLADTRQHYCKPEDKPLPGAVLPEVADYLDHAGINDPLTKIYITGEPLEGFPVLMFLFVLHSVAKLQWDGALNTLVCKSKKDVLDGAPFIVGVTTLLKQFHSSHTHTFLAYLGQFVRSTVSLSGDKNPTMHKDVLTVLLFLEEYCKLSYLNRKSVEALIPSYIFDQFLHE